MWQYICVLLALCACSDQDEIHIKLEGAAGVPKAGPLQQRLTIATSQWCDSLTYDLEKKELYWVDRKGGSVFCWRYPTGLVTPYNITELSTTELGFIVRDQKKDDGYFLGSNLKIYKLTLKDNGDYTLSEPLVTIPGFQCTITQARADCTGQLFIALKCRDDKGILYKIEKKEAVLVSELKIAPTSFAWNNDCTKMYTLDNEMVTEYNFNKETGAIDNGKVIYTLSQTPTTCAKQKLVGINVDKRNDLWLGVEPYTVVVNLKYPNWEYIQHIKLANKHTTSYTFGGYKHRNLMFGTRKLNNPEANNLFSEFGSIYAVTGLNVTGVDIHKANLD